MKWHKSESGQVSATCQSCGMVYYMDNEWDVANLDWHECDATKVGA